MKILIICILITKKKKIFYCCRSVMKKKVKKNLQIKKKYLSLQRLLRGLFSGEMAEWSIAAVLKTVVPRGTGGSNPSFSANNFTNQVHDFVNEYYINSPILFLTFFLLFLYAQKSTQSQHNFCQVFQQIRRLSHCQ